MTAQSILSCAGTGYWLTAAHHHKARGNTSPFLGRAAAIPMGLLSSVSPLEQKRQPKTVACCLGTGVGIRHISGYQPCLLLLAHPMSYPLSTPLCSGMPSSHLLPTEKQEMTQKMTHFLMAKAFFSPYPLQINIQSIDEIIHHHEEPLLDPNCAWWINKILISLFLPHLLYYQNNSQYEGSELSLTSLCC